MSTRGGGGNVPHVTHGGYYTLRIMNLISAGFWTVLRFIQPP